MTPRQRGRHRSESYPVGGGGYRHSPSPKIRNRIVIPVSPSPFFSPPPDRKAKSRSSSERATAIIRQEESVDVYALEVTAGGVADGIRGGTPRSIRGLSLFCRELAHNTRAATDRSASDGAETERLHSRNEGKKEKRKRKRRRGPRAHA